MSQLNQSDIDTIIQVTGQSPFVARKLLEVYKDPNTAVSNYFDNMQYWNSLEEPVETVSVDTTKPIKKEKTSIFSRFTKKPQESHDDFFTQPTSKKSHGSMRDILEEDTSSQRYQGGAAKNQAGTVFETEGDSNVFTIVKYRNGYLIPGASGQKDLFMDSTHPEYSSFEKDINQGVAPEMLRPRLSGYQGVRIEDNSDQDFKIKREDFSGSSRVLLEKTEAKPKKVTISKNYKLTGPAKEGFTIKFRPMGLTYTFDVSCKVGHLFQYCVDNNVPCHTIIKATGDRESYTIDNAELNISDIANGATSFVLFVE